jgi:flagellar basal body-associated protein FliL
VQENSTTPPQDPYSFLYEEAQKPKKGLVPSGNSLKQRLIIVGIAVVLLIIIGLVVVSLLGRGGAANREDLASVVRKQTELIRVADIGAAKATDSRTRGYALTISLSLDSNNEALLAAYKKNGIKLGKDDLAGSKNSATDTKLNTAEQGNNFDAVFTEEINKELTAYKAALRKAYESSSGKATKNALDTAYQQVSVIEGNKPTTQ